MITPEIMDAFHSQFATLREVVATSKNKQLASDGTDVFEIYQNVFTKSYLVSACSILEAFIQELAFSYVEIMRTRFESANIPHNFVVWCTPSGSDKEKDMKFEKFVVNKTKQEISEMISASYYRTRTTFKKIGIDLNCEKIEQAKDFISTTVDKRNKIIHHNDSASDLSYDDIITVINKFEDYMTLLYNKVLTDQHMTEAT